MYHFINTDGIEVYKDLARKYTENKITPVLNHIKDDRRLYVDKTGHGYIDSKGTIAIAGNYPKAHDFSEGLAAVAQRNGNILLWGFIDKNGNMVSDAPQAAENAVENAAVEAQEQKEAVNTEKSAKKKSPQQRFKQMARDVEQSRKELKELSARLAEVEGAKKTLEIAEAERKAKVEELEAKLAAAHQTYELANDNYTRLNAEFDNYRRRTAKEKLELRETASEDVIKGMLPVLDDCLRALDVLRSSDAAEAAIEGTQLIYNKLWKYLSDKGLSEIEAVGQELNTDFHEAVAQFPVEDPAKKAKIIDVAQKGYMLGGKVIRYAKVVVGI